MVAAVRGHRAVENQLHWRLDASLGQDTRHLRDQQAAENPALVRKMALKPSRADPSKGSLTLKRKRLGWNNDYLAALLAQIAKCVWSDKSTFVVALGSQPSRPCRTLPAHERPY